MRNVRTTIPKFLAAATVAGFSAVHALAAQAALEDDTGLYTTAKNAGLVRQTSIPAIVGGTILSLGGLIGTLFLALLVYGGFIWMTAQGKEEQIKKAKGIITSAIIGLVITIAAATISGYVITLATGATTATTTP